MEEQTDTDSATAPPESNPPLALPNAKLSFSTKPLVDHSSTVFTNASILPPSEREVEADGSPSKRAAAKNLKSWIGRLTTFDHPDEDEKHAINQVLGTYGSVRGILDDMGDTKRTNKKLRFREQRFAHDPLLRRRRVDMLSPSLLRVLVVALQNELSASMDLIHSCALEKHPLLKNSELFRAGERRSNRPRDQQDLDRLLASGIAGITPVKSSVADLSGRQRDLIESGLREQNRLLRSQVMRLQSCLTSLPWAEVTTGIHESPRIGTGFQESGYPAGREGGSSSPSRSPTRSPLRKSMSNVPGSKNNNNNSDPIETLKERLSLCAQQIEKMQHELMRTQSELQRTEATVNAQLDIEAKLIEEKAKVMRTNAQLGTFVMKILHECKPKLAQGIMQRKDLVGWLEAHPGKEDYDAAEEDRARQQQLANASASGVGATALTVEDTLRQRRQHKQHKHRRGSRTGNTGGHKGVQTRDAGCLTNHTGDIFVPAASSRNRTRRSSPAESEEEDAFDEEDEYGGEDGDHGDHRDHRDHSPRRSEGDRRTPRRRPTSSASQPGGVRDGRGGRMSDGGNRRSRRPQTADAKRGNRSRRSPNSTQRRVQQTPNQNHNKTGVASIASLAHTARHSPLANQDDAEGGRMYKSARLPGIVTPLDLSRAVGIDPLRVPSKLEDHRPSNSLQQNGLHPDRMTAAMQRPVIFGEHVPHSARVLRIPGEDDAATSGPDGKRGKSGKSGGETERSTLSPKKKKKMTYSSPAERAGGELVVNENVVPFLKPVIMKYDKVLRQIFSHFSQTQAKPVGSQGLFEEIAQWTTSLTHASFFKIMSHFLVVPKLMNKKHAFALLIGTKRMISFPVFIARVLDVAQMIAPRLFVLSDVASVELLQTMFVECAEKEGLLGDARVAKEEAKEGGMAIVGGGGQGGKGGTVPEQNTGQNVDRDVEQEKSARRMYYMKHLTRIPPVSAKVLVATFMEDAKWKVLFREEKILRAMIPENGDGVWGWHEVRSYWWDRCSLSKESVSSGNRSDLMAVFNLPNILPVRQVSPKKRKHMKHHGEEEPVLTPERKAIAFDLLVDFMVQTELPSIVREK